MIRWRFNITVFVIVLSILSLSVYLLGTLTICARINAIAVSKPIVTEQSVEIKGLFMDSAADFRGYGYKIINGDLYVSIKISRFPFRQKLIGDINVFIEDFNIKSINRIYLKGEKEDDVKLIWGKKGV